MKEEHTPPTPAEVSVVGYADGVYNVELSTEDGAEKLSIGRSEAERVCEFLGVSLPDPEPSPPERWG